MRVRTNQIACVLSRISTKRKNVAAGDFGCSNFPPGKTKHDLHMIFVLVSFLNILGIKNCGRKFKISAFAAESSIVSLFLVEEERKPIQKEIKTLLG